MQPYLVARVKQKLKHIPGARETAGITRRRLEHGRQYGNPGWIVIEIPASLSFEVRDGRLNISDPLFFGERVDCATYDLPARRGRWHARVSVSEYGSWGKRISEMICVHESITFEEPVDTLISDDIGVDAATVCIYEFEDGLELAYERELDFQSGRFGVCSTSGIGDGQYRAYGAYSGEELTAVRVVYIPDAKGRMPPP